MNADDILLSAFENIAGHLTNLDLIRTKVNELTGHDYSIEEIIHLIEGEMEAMDVTIRTDLRILINEIRHLMIRMSSG
ncbi:MAG: hypothetical protein ACFE7R_07055 [Candidatus Hodarchaeota archaeon]